MQCLHCVSQSVVPSWMKLHKSLIWELRNQQPHSSQTHQLVNSNNPPGNTGHERTERWQGWERSHQWVIEKKCQRMQNKCRASVYPVLPLRPVPGKRCASRRNVLADESNPHTFQKKLILLRESSQVSLGLPNNNYKTSGAPRDKQPHALNPSVISQVWPGLSRRNSRLSPRP